MKLSVYKTFKFEVINIEFYSRDLPLDNPALMVLDLQSIDAFEIFNSYTFYLFFLYSVGILALHTLNALSPVFSGMNNNSLFLCCLKDIEDFSKLCLLSAASLKNTMQ